MTNLYTYFKEQPGESLSPLPPGSEPLFQKKSELHWLRSRSKQIAETAKHRDDWHDAITVVA